MRCLPGPVPQASQQPRLAFPPADTSARVPTLPAQCQQRQRRAPGLEACTAAVAEPEVGAGARDGILSEKARVGDTK